MYRPVGASDCGEAGTGTGGGTGTAADTRAGTGLGLGSDSGPDCGAGFSRSSALRVSRPIMNATTPTITTIALDHMKSAFVRVCGNLTLSHQSRVKRTQG